MVPILHAGGHRAVKPIRHPIFARRFGYERNNAPRACGITRTGSFNEGARDARLERTFRTGLVIGARLIMAGPSHSVKKRPS